MTGRAVAWLLFALGAGFACANLDNLSGGTPDAGTVDACTPNLALCAGRCGRVTDPCTGTVVDCGGSCGVGATCDGKTGLCACARPAGLCDRRCGKVTDPCGDEVDCNGCADAGGCNDAGACGSCTPEEAGTSC